MIKLIVSDLDGTIVPEGTFDINPEFDKVFSTFIDKGVNVILASGRHANNIKKLLPMIKDRAYILSDTGATLLHKDKALIKHHLNKETVRYLLDYLHDDAGCEVALSNDIGYYTEPRDKFINDNVFADVKEVGYIVDNVYEHLDGVTKLTAMTKDPVQEVIAPLKEKFKNELHIVQSGTIWFDITKIGVTKGEGVKFVQNLLGVKKEETIGFGNSENDIPLLNECGMAYTVEDASDAVKKHANEVLPDVFNNGVLNELKRILTQQFT